MQVGSSSSSLAAQLQALESAAQGQYQSGGDFDFMVNQATAGQATAGQASGGQGGDASSSSANGTATAAGSGQQLSGAFQATSLIAVGTVGPNGTMQTFSPQQIQSEQADVAKMSQTAYSNSLQNFMALAQASGQMGGASYTDQQSFMSGDGDISASFTSQFSLQPSASS